MLNPFPDLLWLGFFAPTVLRLAAAAVLLIGAYAHYTSKGSNSTALAAAHALLGGMLFFGWYTQYAALIGIVGIVACYVLPKKLLNVDPLPWATSLLLFAIFLSLLVSGAGAFAFDLPL
ncbi:MAG: hypothetical protein KBD50_03270 [Candidatus Pacebacteria bacterium]|nr:hypothetical protein [Candidatus Paceibacterota bacterium]